MFRAPSFVTWRSPNTAARWGRGGLRTNKVSISFPAPGPFQRQAQETPGLLGSEALTPGMRERSRVATVLRFHVLRNLSLLKLSKQMAGIALP